MDVCAALSVCVCVVVDCSCVVYMMCCVCVEAMFCGLKLCI